jgi:hypothetical protein
VLLFRPFALGQIEDERDALVTAFFKQRAANKYGQATATFAEILLLDWLESPG